MRVVETLGLDALTHLPRDLVASVFHLSWTEDVFVSHRDIERTQVVLSEPFPIDFKLRDVVFTEIVVGHSFASHEFQKQVTSRVVGFGEHTLDIALEQWFEVFRNVAFTHSDFTRSLVIEVKLEGSVLVVAKQIGFSFFDFRWQALDDLRAIIQSHGSTHSAYEHMWKRGGDFSEGLAPPQRVESRILLFWFCPNTNPRHWSR